jgi:hypothetical protein
MGLNSLQWNQINRLETCLITMDPKVHLRVDSIHWVEEEARLVLVGTLKNERLMDMRKANLNAFDYLSFELLVFRLRDSQKLVDSSQ